MDVKVVINHAKIGRTIGPVEKDQYACGRVDEIKRYRICLENDNGGGDKKLVRGIIKLKKKKVV